MGEKGENSGGWLGKLSRFSSHELVRGSGQTLFIRVAGIAFTYAFSLLVTNLLGPAAFGDYSFLVLLINVLSVFSALGFDGLVVRHVAAKQALDDWQGLIRFHRLALRLQIAASLLLGGVLLLAQYMGWLTAYGNAFVFLMIAAGILPQTLLKYHSQAFKAFRQIRWYAILNYVASPFFALILLLALFYADPERAAGWAQVGSLWLAIGLALVIWKKTVHSDRPYVHQAAAWTEYKDMVRHSWPFLLTGSVMFFNHWIDQLVLKSARGSYDLGIYAAGNRVVNLVTIPLMAVNSIVAPKLARCWAQQDQEGLQKAARQATRLIIWSSAPIFLVVLALAGPLLHLFGRNFPEGALAMRILIIGQFCNVLVGPMGAVLNMTRYDRLMNKLAMISVVVNFVVSAWLAPSWGAAGAATGSSAGLVVLNGLAWYFIRRKLGFSTIRL